MRMTTRHLTNSCSKPCTDQTVIGPKFSAVKSCDKFDCDPDQISLYHHNHNTPKVHKNWLWSIIIMIIKRPKISVCSQHTPVQYSRTYTEYTPNSHLCCQRGALYSGQASPCKPLGFWCLTKLDQASISNLLWSPSSPKPPVFYNFPSESWFQSSFYADLPPCQGLLMVDQAQGKALTSLQCSGTWSCGGWLLFFGCIIGWLPWLLGGWLRWSVRYINWKLDE